MTWKLLPPPRRRRKTLQPLHLLVILPKGSRRLKQKVKLLLSFLRLLRSLMPTRTRKARAKVGREDHHHPLTRRRSSAITSSIKVDVTKVTNVSTVILRKVYDAKMKDKKSRSRSRDSSGRKSKGSSSSAGPKKKVCWQWQKGTCTFGSKCKFLHADQSPSASSERTSNKDKKKKAVPITIDSFFDSDTEDAKGLFLAEDSQRKEVFLMFARLRLTWSLRSTRFLSRTIRRECPNESIATPKNPMFSGRSKIWQMINPNLTAHSVKLGQELKLSSWAELDSIVM